MSGVCAACVCSYPHVWHTCVTHACYTCVPHVFADRIVRAVNVEILCIVESFNFCISTATSPNSSPLERHTQASAAVHHLVDIFQFLVTFFKKNNPENTLPYCKCLAPFLPSLPSSPFPLSSDPPPSSSSSASTQYFMNTHVICMYVRVNM